MRRRHYLSVLLTGLVAGCPGQRSADSTPTTTPDSGYGGTPTTTDTSTSTATQTVSPTATSTATPTASPTASPTPSPTATTTPASKYGSVGYGEGGYGGTR